MPHHVFISFSSRDREAAQRIRDVVEAAGPRCWISSRDVGPGENYQTRIVAALHAAPVFLLVFSPHSNDSPEVHKEVSLASAYKKTVIPVRIADTSPSGAMAYELATRQWLDAFNDWDLAMTQLVAAIEGAIDAIPASAPPPPIAETEVKPPAIFSARELEKAKVALSDYMGAAADGMIRKAAAEARSVGDLYSRLAAAIDGPADQAAFRQRAKRRA